MYEINEAEYPVQIAIGLVRKLKFLGPVSNIALIKRSPLPQRSSVRVEVELVQRLSARGDGDELDRAEILVKAQRQTPAFGSHQLLYITHGIKFARIKRHAIGWRRDARPVLICIVVKYFRIVAYKTDLSGISWCPQQLAAHIRAALFEYFIAEREVAPKSASLVLVGARSEEHQSALQSLMRISYAVFGLIK